MKLKNLVIDQEVDVTCAVKREVRELITRHPTVYAAPDETHIRYHDDIDEWCVHWTFAEDSNYDIVQDISEAIEVLYTHICISDAFLHREERP